MTRRAGFRAALLCLLAVLLAPAIVLADAGTALMWATVAHLTFGNLIIGVIEAWLLSRMFPVGGRRTTLIMIAANFASAWVGMMVVGNSWVSDATLRLVTRPDSLPRIRTIFVCFVALSFVATVLLEWPFVFWAIRRQRTSAWRALGASAILQTVSYTLLVPFFFAASSSSLFTDVRVDQSLLAQADPSIMLFYVGPDDHTLWEQPLQGGGPAIRLSTVSEASFSGRTGSRAVLFPVESSDGLGWDLRWETADGRAGVAITAFARQSDAVEDLSGGIGDSRTASEIQWLLFRPDWAYPRRPPLSSRSSGWTYRVAPHWQFASRSRGLTVTSLRDGKSYSVACELPFLSMATAFPTRLPNDQVLFELGRQIVLLDMPSRRLAFVAAGGQPVATLDGAIPALPAVY